MSANKTTILLDTNVVAGLFSISDKKKNPQNTQEWQRAIDSLVLNLGEFSQLRLVAPTPICYELMCWNEKWFDFVTTSENQLFCLSRNEIDYETLKLAAQYSYKCGVKFNNSQDHKLMSMDPILAVYSITNGNFILTQNQKDFPESCFQIIGIETVILRNNSGDIYRNFLYLLKPIKKLI